MRALFTVLAVSIVSASGADGPDSIGLRLTIDDPHPESQRNFGWSVDTFNNNLLVGSFWGSVYVMDPQTGAEILRLQSPEGLGSFGRSMTQFGDRIVVGANEVDIEPHVRVGSAYIFDGESGAHRETLRNPRPSHFGWFGFSMEDAADRLFVSSGSSSTSDRGTVYVYEPDSSTPMDTLLDPQATVRGAWGFGFALEKNKEDLFVSAIGANATGTGSGAIYRYDATTLELELTIENPHPESQSHFGRSLSANGKMLLAGAPALTVGDERLAGGAYLFDAATGSLLQTFLSPEPQERAGFGEAVAIVGGYAVIGSNFYSPTPDGRPLHAGAAFVYDLNTGGFVTRIDNPSPEQNDWFTGGDGTTLTSIRGQLAIGHGYEQQVHLFTVPEPTGLVLAACVGVFLAAGRRSD